MLALVAFLAAQVSVDPTPLLTAGDEALANAVVDRLLDEGYVLVPPSPRQARVFLSFGKDGVIVSLDDDVVGVPRGDDALVAAECAQVTLGLLREKRVSPDRTPRGAVDVDASGHAAALALGAQLVGVPVARRAKRRLCVHDAVTLIDVDVDACSAGPAPLSWTAARDGARDVLLDADLSDLDEDGWAEAPRTAGLPGLDERTLRVRRTALFGGLIGARVHALVGTSLRPPAVDPSVGLAVDVAFDNGWSASVVTSGASRVRQDVRATNLALGVGAARVQDIGHDVFVSAGAVVGVAVDLLQREQSLASVPSLALIAPLSVGYALSDGSRVEAATWLRVTDGAVAVKVGPSRTIWEGGAFSAFVGVGASFGAAPIAGTP